MKNIALRDKIIEALGIPEKHLNRLIIRAPHTYKVYFIPKKNTGRRTIAQPAKETKYIQHWLMKTVFDSLPLHECATAYKPGASIKLNASKHAGGSYIVKFDFKDFFTSIKDEHLRMHLEKHLGGQLSSEDISDIVRVSCIKFSGKESMCLSIGAPSSPMLSNSIMHEFDQKVSDWCSEKNIIYTRYADDLTFSTNARGLSCDIEKVIREIAKHLEYPAIRFNRKKTTYLSKKHQRRVTGLILNNEGKVSLGRERKRKISSLVHKYSIKALDEGQILHLQGLLGFAKDVEPLFVARLRAKYGAQVIDEVFSRRKSPTNKSTTD